MSRLRAVTTEVLWQLGRRRRALLGWAIGLVAVAAVYIPLYPSIGGEQMQALVDSLPAEMTAALGYDRLGTAAGYVTSTVFGLLGPALMLVFGIGLGARTIAGEEEPGELELAAAAPVRRDDLLAGRIIAVHTQIAALAVVTFVASTLLSASVDLDISVAGIAAASLGLNLIAIAFATITLAAGALSGRRAVAVAVGAGVAVAAFVADAVAGMLTDGALLEAISPFSWYLAGDPVGEGIPLGGYVRLGVLTFVAWAAALVRFPRRDLGV